MSSIEAIILFVIFNILVKFLASFNFNSYLVVSLKNYKYLLSVVFIFNFNLGDLSPCLKIETIDLNYYD
jgi:hypothetical protein